MRTLRIAQEHVRISDPHITSDNAERLSILGNVVDPLMRVREDGTFQPALASSWTLSEDATQWTFRIRDDVTFHNGKKLLPEDVVFSLTRMRDEDLPGELGTRGVIRGYLAESVIDTDSEGNVRLRTPEPMADLLDLLSEIPILSASSVESLPQALIGTGRFRIESMDDALVVLSSDDLRIEWIADPDPSSRLGRVQSSDVDAATKIAVADANTEDVRIVRSSTSVCATFMFNLQSAKMQDLHLRKAINMAVDVDTLIKDVMNGAADPLAGPLTSRHLGYDRSGMAWPYDPAAARKELQQCAVQPDEVLIDIPAVLPDEAPALAERIVEYLAAIGLSARIRMDSDRPGYATRIRDGHIGDMACFDSSPASTYRIYREKFHSGFAGPWWMGYCDTEFDALVDRGRGTPNLSARKTLYRSAYTRLSKNAPWLFLYNPVRLTALGPVLDEWDPGTGGLMLF